MMLTQMISYTGSGTVVSTNFTSQTYQIRISTLGHGVRRDRQSRHGGYAETLAHLQGERESKEELRQQPDSGIVPTCTGRLEGPSPDVRFGSKADIDGYQRNVRFTPKSGHQLSAPGCPLSAKSGHQAELPSYGACGLPALKAVAKDDAHAADNRRWGMSNRCCSYIKLGFSAVLLAAAMTLQNATPVHAAIKAWSSAFHDQQMAVSGGTQYVRIGGHGPAVLLLHGFGDTGDMWLPLAEILVKDHTVVVPDLRGMGLSSHQDGGYEKTAQARDLADILDKLGIQKCCSRHPRHWQHGRLRPGGAISCKGDPMGCYGCAASRDRPLG